MKTITTNGRMKDWLMPTMHLRGTESLWLLCVCLGDVDFYTNCVKTYNFILVKRFR